MKNCKFVHFLDDPKEYSEAEKFWKNLIEEVISENLHFYDWEDWFHNRYADGTLIRDGNPIVSMISRKLGLGIRIIQYDPFDKDATDNDFEIGAWVDYYGKSSKDKGIRTLVISCIVTEETEIIAKNIIHAFIIKKMSDKEMECLLA